MGNLWASRGSDQAWLASAMADTPTHGEIYRDDTQWRRLSSGGLRAMTPHRRIRACFARHKKNKGRHCCRPLLVFGARSWTRTNDPLINSPLLNQYVTESLAKLGEGLGS
jgi:hypothetical protein